MSSYVATYFAARATHGLVHVESFGGSASELNSVRVGDGGWRWLEIPFTPLMRLEALVWYLD